MSLLDNDAAEPLIIETTDSPALHGQLQQDEHAPNAEMDELRSLILAPALREIDRLTERVATLEQSLLETRHRAGAVGEVLVEAVQARHGDNGADGELSDALRPDVELAIHRSSRDDASVMAEALYPVLGPAIRKMIASLFTLGDSDTFRVDQVLLTHRETGVLLSSYGRNPDELNEADIISGMLDAIGTFVEDAFDATEFDGLNDLRVGDVTVMVEWGPRAILALVVRGVVPSAFRNQVRMHLEQIHASYQFELEHFRGDVTPFNGLVAGLETLQRSSGKGAGTSSRRRLAIAAAVLAAIIAVVVLVIVL